MLLKIFFSRARFFCICLSILISISCAFAQKKVIENDSIKTRSRDSLSSKDIHPQDSPESSGFFIVSKNGKSSIRILGSARLFGCEDWNGLNGGTGFSISEIPVGDDIKNERTYFMTANLSRVGLEATHETPVGNVLVKIESDFNGSGTNYRIRHAYGQTKFLIVGQTWTGFSDIETLPNTVDLDGPPTAVSLRTVQIKYYLDFKPGWRFRASIESPGNTINIPDSVSLEPVSQNYPAVALNIKKNWKNFEIKFAGVVNPISVRNFSGDRVSLFGGGGLLSSKVSFGNNRIMFQGLFGSGIASFLNLSDNEAFDVILNPATSSYQLTSCSGGFVAYSRAILERLLTLDLVYGMVKFRMEDNFADDTFEFGQYAAATLFLYLQGFRIGAEYTYGFKRTKDSSSGNANRTAFTFYYDF